MANIRVLRDVLTAGMLCASVFIGAAPAAAQSGATTLGSFNKWTAWSATDANGPICFISSQPDDAQPANVNRDPISFLIIHRKGLGTKNEVQTLVGYPLRDGSTPTVAIDGQSYSMVIEGNAAWLASTADEPTFVAAMKKGSSMVVKGTSQRGTNTTDTYSLAGVTAAMAEIDKACS